MVNLQVTEQGSIALVKISGRIDSTTANNLGSGLAAVIDDGHRRIVLDLSLVDYMSSAGLRELVAALKRVKKVSGDMRIANPSSRVREVMEMAGLDTIFLIFDTQDEAFQSY